MIHRSCGFAARPMDHATGENLFMIDFRRYLYQFTTKFSIQLNLVCTLTAAAVKRLDRHCMIFDMSATNRLLARRSNPSFPASLLANLGSHILCVRIYLTFYY